MLKIGGELVCPSIPMELVYLNCYVAENNELDEAVTQILGIFDGDEWIPREQFEQIEHVLIYPMNLAEYEDKLVERETLHICHIRIWRSLQFCIEGRNRTAEMLQKSIWKNGESVWRNFLRKSDTRMQMK